MLFRDNLDEASNNTVNGDRSVQRIDASAMSERLDYNELNCGPISIYRQAFDCGLN